MADTAPPPPPAGAGGPAAAVARLSAAVTAVAERDIEGLEPATVDADLKALEAVRRRVEAHQHRLIDVRRRRRAAEHRQRGQGPSP